MSKIKGEILKHFSIKVKVWCYPQNLKLNLTVRKLFIKLDICMHRLAMLITDKNQQILYAKSGDYLFKSKKHFKWIKDYLQWFCLKEYFKKFKNHFKI